MKMISIFNSTIPNQLCKERLTPLLSFIIGMKKWIGAAVVLLSDCRPKAILPRRGRIALFANERIAEFLILLFKPSLLMSTSWEQLSGNAVRHRQYQLQPTIPQYRHLWSQHPLQADRNVHPATLLQESRVLSGASDDTSGYVERRLYLQNVRRVQYAL